jgi:hypothetical protein
MEVLINALAAAISAFDAYGSAVADKFVALVPAILFPVAGLLICWAIFYTLFEEDLVDGVRKVMEVIIISALVLGAVNNWGYISNSLKAISAEYTEIVASTAKLPGGKDTPFATRIAQAFLDVSVDFARMLDTKLYPGNKLKPTIPAESPSEDTESSVPAPHGA